MQVLQPMPVYEKGQEGILEGEEVEYLAKENAAAGEAEKA